MAGGLKEVRERIGSVQNTMQITSAMKMVSAAKLRRAQDAITRMRPYAEKIQSILANVSATLDSSEGVFSEDRNVKTALVVCITSDRGLCGAFNNYSIKIAKTAVEAYEANGVKALVVPLRVIREDASGRPFIYKLVETDKKDILLTVKIFVETGANNDEEIEITKGLSIGDIIVLEGANNVEDNQINQYLDNKNLNENRKNSIGQKKISRIDHYIWWFTNKSHLFYYIRNNKIRIFFNHRIISINKEKFFYGGWFITKNKIRISDPMFVVKWQINKYKSFPWLAIIKRKNIFVHKLNKHLKFKEINFNKKFRSFFNIQNQKTYYLLKK